MGCESLSQAISFVIDIDLTTALVPELLTLLFYFLTEQMGTPMSASPG